jgi:PAS domain-containing protein
MEDLRREIARLLEEHESFLFHLPDALVESDVADHRARYMNRMAQILFGYSDVGSGRQELYEFRMRRKDGTEFVAETQSSFVLDGRGRPVRMRSIVRDVTERREMERRLEEMSHRARRLMEAAASDSPAAFSLGVAFRRSGEAIDAVLARADRTLYAARGRRLRKRRRPTTPGSGQDAAS